MWAIDGMGGQAIDRTKNNYNPLNILIPQMFSSTFESYFHPKLMNIHT